MDVPWAQRDKDLELGIGNSLSDLVNRFTNCHNCDVWLQRPLEAHSNSVPLHSCGAKCRKDQVSTRHVWTKPKNTKLRMQFETSRVMSLVVLKEAYYLHLCVCTYVSCLDIGHVPNTLKVAAMLFNRTMGWNIFWFCIIWNHLLMCDSCHIWSVLIGVECRSWCWTLDVYIFTFC